MAILKSVFVVATADREGTDSSSRRHGFDFLVNYLEILVTLSGHCRVLEGEYVRWSQIQVVERTNSPNFALTVNTCFILLYKLRKCPFT